MSPRKYSPPRWAKQLSPKHLHRNLRDLGLAIPEQETRQNQIGDATTEAIRQFQVDHELKPTGKLNAATAKAIKDAAAAVPRRPRGGSAQRPGERVFVVQGTVRDSDAESVSGHAVRAFSKGLRDEIALGDAKTNGSGAYRIEYAPPKAGSRSLNLVVRVYGSKQEVLASSPVLFNAKPDETVDVTVGGGEYRGPSDYERYSKRIAPHLMGLPLVDLTEEQVRFVKAESGLDPLEIDYQVAAAKMAKDAGLPAEVLYGLMRVGLPNDLDRLLAQPPAAQREALNAALARSLIPQRFKAQAESALRHLRELFVERVFQAPVGTHPMVGLLESVLADRSRQKAFFKLYVEHEGSSQDFWESLRRHPDFEGYADEIRLTLQLGALTGYHVPAVQAIRGRLRAEGRTLSPSNLAKFDPATWREIVRAAGVPEDVRGDTEDERFHTYATALQQEVEKAHPSAAIIAQIARSNLPLRAELNAFFAKHPDFDLLVDSVDTVEPAGEGLAEHVRQELKRVQRLARVAPSSTGFQVLSDSGFSSASQIAAMSQGAFVARYGAALGGADAARAIHEKAAQRSAIIHDMRMRYGAEQGVVRPKGIPPAFRPPWLAPRSPETPIDWTTLFGSPDVCACEHDRSVLGPAAYLVDLLQFVKRETETGLDNLLDVRRRPDLQDIKLNAQNATTPVPYIDLAIEIFEQAVVGKAGSQKRQTMWSEAELAANPEHTDPAAYETLRGALFPWNLPFDLEATEARAYLEHLGAARHELMETFYVPPDGDALQDAAIAREYLRMTQEEWGLISGAEAYGAGELWGLKEEQLGLLRDPRHVMTRAGVSLEELQQLLSTQFIDPTRQLAVECPNCTLQGVEIDFEADALVRFCRFVRLWRALGWSIDEVDAALGIFAGTEAPVTIPLVAFSHVQRVRERLSLPIMEVLSFYADLDHLPAPAGSQAGETRLDTVFFSRLVTGDDDRSRAFRDALKDTNEAREDKTIVAHLPAITAGLGISANDVLALLDAAQEVFATTPAEANVLSVANLSLLYRVAKLCHATGLSVLEYIALVGLTDVSPVLTRSTAAPDVPRSTLTFLAERDYVRNSGFAIRELDGLLRARPSEEAAATPFRQNAVFLEQLRAGLQRIGAELNVPDEASPNSLEALLHQRLALYLESPDIGVVLSWLQQAPPGASAPSLPVSLIESALNNAAAQFSAMPSAEAGQAEQLASRYLLVLELLRPEFWKTLSRSLIKEEIGKGLRVEAAVAEQLLEVWVDAAGDPDAQSAIGAFMRPPFWEGMEPLVKESYAEQLLARDDAASHGAFLTLERLQKVALVLSRLRISFGEARYLFTAEKDWLDLGQLPVDENANDAHLYASWKRLVDACRLNHRLGPKEPTLFDLFDLFARAEETEVVADYDTAITALCARTGWQRDDVDRLNNDFGYTAGSFADERAFLKLEACVQLSRRLGASISKPWNMIEWATSEPTSGVAASVKRAARAKYADDKAWSEVARPLQNTVREQKRAALVGYLTASLDWTTEQLYGHFLIDPEMSGCMLTSRIVQATNSVQLFVQRAFLGLETVTFSHPASAAAQWEWMKNYRVWEANRKIFLFPENWSEPELRDDKSPFFQELENELRQAELTPEHAETVYRNYLEKLRTVANLEIVGHCQGQVGGGGPIVGCFPTLHVLGRTRETPRAYYLRHRTSFGTWTPWEKVNVDVESDQLLPTVWNGRLWLFWPVFKEATQRSQGGGEPLRAWAIRLASTKYVGAGWTPKRVSKESLVPWTWESAWELTGESKESGSPESTLIDTVLPVYVRSRSDMPGLLAPVFDDNSSLFSFIPRRSDDQTITIDVQYPWLLGGAWRRDGQVVLPGNSGYASMDPARSIGLPLTPTGDVGTTIGGSFLISSNGVTVDGRVVESKAAGWRTREFLLQTIPDSGEIYGKNAYPMQGMGLCGFGDPYYTGPDTTITLWTGEGDAAFRITPPAEEPGMAGALALVYDLFVSHGQRTFWIERRDQQRPARIFYHPFVTNCIQLVDSGGLDRLLKPAPDSEYCRQRAMSPIINSQGGSLTPVYSGINWTSPVSYPGLYSDFPMFTKPREDITFENDEAYACYNWELFFHIPLLIADRLSKNQQFEAAMRWYHYIYDPLDSRLNYEYGCEWQQPWRLGRFYDNGDATRSIAWLMTVLSNDAVIGDDALGWHQTPAAQIRLSLVDQIDQWRTDPFKPHRIARLRITPYMKTVVMKYLDNLIAWADQLFRRNTIESINEATQLYILAAEILGARPEEVPEQPHSDRTYADLEALGIDDFSNALENALVTGRSISMLDYADRFVGVQDFARLSPVIFRKLLGGSNAEVAQSVYDGPQTSLVPRDAALLPADARDAIGALTLSGSMPEIKIPPFPGLGGVGFNLPAAGLYFCIPQNDHLLTYWNTVAGRLFKIRHCLNIEGVEQRLPLFQPPIEPGLLVKAAAAGVDFSTVLSDLGAPLPHHRFTVLVQKAAELCQEVKALGGALLAALEKRDAEGLAVLRSEHEISLLESVRDVRKQQVREAEQTLEGLNRAREVTETRYEYYKNVEKLTTEERLYIALTGAGIAAQLAGQALELSAAAAEPEPDLFTGAITVGPMPGGIGLVHAAGGSKVGSALQLAGRAAGTLASMLSTSANLSATLATYSRRWDEWKLQERLAQRELKQIDKQIAAAEVRVAIAEQEFSNNEQQIENARAVDDYMRSKFTNQELYDWMVGQIAGVYFQSYQLAYDMAKRAERTYRFELGLEDSNFIQFGYWDSLRKGLLAGERLYHDLRRIEADYLEQNRREYEISKNVSLALLKPAALVSLRETGVCFVDLPEALFDLDCPGQYMRRIKSVSLTIPCVTGPYTSVNCVLTLVSSRIRKNSTLKGEAYKYEDPSYDISPVALQSVVTSSGQNDSGVFELNFRDERYLPFEGAGAISRWRLELPHDFPQFDYNTIADVIFHVRYTAREGGAHLREKAVEALKERLAAEEAGLARVFSFRHEFPDAFNALLHSPKSTPVEIEITEKHFPFFLVGKSLAVHKAQIALKTTSGQSVPSVKISVDEVASSEFSGDLGGLPAATIESIVTRLKGKHAFTIAESGDLAYENAPAGDLSAVDPSKLLDILLYVEFVITPM